MALRKKGRYYYGDNQDDLADELKRYAKLNEYPVNEVEHIKCAKCEQQLFKLISDYDEGGAVCQCINCSEERDIKDSKQYMQQENMNNNECVCGNATFNIAVALSFYSDTNDVRWVYVGGLCSSCGVLGTYVDWNER